MEDDKNLPHVEQNRKQENRSVPSQVLEYYTKYSLNQELPKYFCGTSTFQFSDWHSNQADIHVPFSSTKAVVHKPVVKPSVGILDDISENPLVTFNDDEEAVIPPSPASSVASNKKLEWDNGADIGYSNAVVHRTLQKSISLPVLNKFEYKTLQDALLRQPSCSHNVEVGVPDTKGSNKSTSSGEVGQDLILGSSSSSSDVALQQKRSVTSSTSSSFQPQLSNGSESDSLHELSEFLQERIPVAESTPFNLQESPCLGTSSLNKKNAQTESSHQTFAIDINMIDKVTHYKHFKMLTLSTSKPVVVECSRNLGKSKNAQNKLIQTSLVKNVSIGIQTDSSLFVQKVCKSQRSEHQGVFYMYHSNSDSENNTNNSSVQTDSDIFSNHCQSFEFLQGDDLKDKSNIGLSKLQRCTPNSDLANVPLDRESTISSQNSVNPKTSPSSPLAQLLSSSESPYRIHDFQKKVGLLQAMLKSCKYNASTKKFYMKQFLRKMFETRYSDDTTCEPNLQVNELAKNDKTDNINQQQLQQNKPWVPIQNRNLQVETFINEIIPEGANRNAHFVPIQNTRLPRNHILTLTSPQPLVNNSPILQCETTETPTGSINNATPASHISSDKTWRDDKTSSEKKLEAVGDGDSSALKPVRKSLEEDLAWINKEILHLNKLKKKLQENKTENIIQTILHKPEINDLKGHKQSTTVYVLTTETGKDYVYPYCRPHICPNSNCVRYQNIQRSTNNVCTCSHRLSSPKNQSSLNRPEETKHKLQSRSYPTTSGSASVTPTMPTVLDVPPESLKRSASTGIKPKPYQKFKHISSPSSLRSTMPNRPEQWFTVEPDHENAPYNTYNTNNKKIEQYEVPTGLPPNANVPSNSSTSKSSVRSYALEIPILPTVEKLNAHGKKACRCFCSTRKLKQPNLIQELVSVESIGDNNGVKKSLDQAQNLVDAEKQKCTCCPACLQSADDKVGSDSSRQASTHTKSNQGSVEAAITSVQGMFNENPSDKGNTASKIANSMYRAEYPRGVNVRSHSPTDVQKEVEIATHVFNGKRTSRELDGQKRTEQGNQFAMNNEDMSEWKNKDQQTQTSELLAKVSSQQSTSSSTGTQSSSTTTTTSVSVSELCIPLSHLKNKCDCCNRQVAVSALEKHLKYILCQPCYMQKVQTPYYTYPGNVCKCHVQTTQILQEIRDTVRELNMLENDNYCNCHNSIKQQDSEYCLNCKCKIKDKHVSKKGIAYTLTLQPADKKHKKSRKHTKSSFEEIKLKVPTRNSKKHHNNHTSSSDESFDKENSPKKQKQKKNHHKKKSEKKQTLQDYLFVNKPDFIASAEQRRRCLIDLAYTREQRCLKYKQLLGALADFSFQKVPLFQNFVTNNQQSGQKHLFTAAEMKQITAKNYKKLPEVQQKLMERREKQVKKANKLLTDIFNHRLRQHALKGKLTIPTTTSIIKLD